jgi:hypothetical protein
VVRWTYEIQRALTRYRKHVARELAYADEVGLYDNLCKGLVFIVLISHSLGFAPFSRTELTHSGDKASASATTASKAIPLCIRQ